MRKNKIRILHVAQAAGGVDRYIRMLLKYLDKDKFENVLVCSQDFHKEDYNGLVDYFEQIEMTRAIGASDLKATKAVRKLIKKYNPDIVYAHSSKAGAIARIADIGLKNYCIFPLLGVRFISVNDGYDSGMQAGNDVRGLEVAIKNIINASYSRDLSAKIAAADHVMQKKGMYLGGLTTTITAVTSTVCSSRRRCRLMSVP